MMDVVRRYLAGIRFEDATTGAPVTRPLQLRGTGTSFVQNGLGIWALRRAPGLDEHVGSFAAPPPTPAPGSLAVDIDVRDPEGAYLARRFRLQLPRTGPEGDAPITEPVVVGLFRSPRAQVPPHWAVVYGGLVRAGAGGALGRALVRVHQRASASAPARLLGASLSVWQDPASGPLGFSANVIGQFAVPLPAVPALIWGDDDDDAVLASEMPVDVEVVPLVTTGDLPPDPDSQLETPALASNRWTFSVAAGRRVNAGELAVTVPG